MGEGESWAMSEPAYLIIAEKNRAIEAFRLMGNELSRDLEAAKAEIERLKPLAVRAWHSFRSTLPHPECERGLRNEDIEALVKLATEVDCKESEDEPHCPTCGVAYPAHPTMFELCDENKRLKDAVRVRGGCRMLSLGDQCDCGLCLRDAEIKRLQFEIDKRPAGM